MPRRDAPRVAVVGAGVAGLVAARTLSDAGAAVTVFDKGRGIGGRLAQRRTDLGPFDHGAPLMQGEDAAFATWMHDAETAGTARRLNGGWIGVPSMNAPLKRLAEGLDVRASTEIGGLSRDGVWRAADASGATLGEFDRLILAVPAPQARKLVAAVEPGLAEALGAVRMAPQWTLMLGLGAASAPPRPGGAIERIVTMQDRPDREGTAGRWVVHATAAWSRANLEAERTSIQRLLLSELSAAMDAAIPRPAHAAAHRWRYARAEIPLGAPFAASADGTLLCGGDWTLGAEAGHAFASGQAMARALA